MYKLNKKRVDEMITMIQSPLFKKRIENGELIPEDLFSEDEQLKIKWRDYFSMACDIHSKHGIMYSKQRDCFYKFDKQWRVVEKSQRNDVHDIIRKEAKNDGIAMEEVNIRQIEDEIRHEADEFPLDEDDNMVQTRYDIYLFNNGTLYYDQETGDYEFYQGFKKKDKVRKEENAIFPYDFTEDISGITELFKVFVEWGISPKQIMFIMAFAVFCKKDYLNMMFYFVGSGANGKTQLLKLIESLFPRSGITNLQVSKLSGDKDGSEALESSYVNISSEIKLQDFDSTFMKAITGGDTITVNPKNLKPYSIIPTAKHFVSSNSMPHLRETTHGDLRRFLIIEFNRTFPPSQGFFDKRLKPYIPQLFTYLLKLSKRIKQEGMYIDNKLVMKTREEISNTSDMVYKFIDEFEITKATSGNDFIDRRTLYSYFEDWCRYNNRGVYSNQRFMDHIYKHLGKNIICKGHKYRWNVYFDKASWKEYKTHMISID